VAGTWPDESSHRRFALQWLREHGHQHVLILDSDEVVEPQLLEHLQQIAAAGLAERVYVHMDTYWKSPQYVSRPRERLTPVVMIDVQKVEHVHIREYTGGRAMVLGPEYGVIHHLSYAGPDERILRKISTWSHRDEVVEDWYRRVWQGWDSDKLMRNLHPTHPGAYGFAERIPCPEILKGCWDDVPASCRSAGSFRLADALGRHPPSLEERRISGFVWLRWRPVRT